MDYLIESILQPNAKIKENYHSLVVVADGRITSGIKARETDKELPYCATSRTAKSRSRWTRSKNGRKAAR